MKRLSFLFLPGLLAACSDNQSPTAASPETDESPQTAFATNPAETADTATANVEAVKTAHVKTEDASEKATTVSMLPLKRGFYVASDTPCGQASNATLLLVRRDGMGGSRDSCEFRKIEKTGATTYRVTEECSISGGGWNVPTETETSTSTFEIPNNTSFKSTSESGWVSISRYCAQASLPEPWRDNDIADLIR